MVSKEILEQVKGVSALIKYFVMTYKNPNLEGLSILDTPGFNSNDKEDRDRTIDVINECDALFWVFDVNAGTVNRSSISVIKEKLNKPLYVVINKIDTKSATEVQKVENLIRKTLSDEGLSIQGVIRFSSQAPLADIMNPIKSVTKNTARDTFVTDVGNDIDQLINGLKAGIKKKNTEYNKAVQKGNDITDNFINSVRVMRSNCESARNTPHFETHLFHSDKYEMSEEEFNHLSYCLDLIADDNISDLANAFDNRVENQGDIQKAWTELKEIETSLQKVEECKEQYKKLTKNLR
jgi:tRNA U34 5-carboxymethylaminomethyl modifying GTPase MnmE/TrmE